MTISGQNRKRSFFSASDSNKAKMANSRGELEEVAVELILAPNSFLSEVAIKHIIDQAAEMDVSILRFVLIGQSFREEDYKLFEYARNENFEIRLDISNFKIKNIRLFARKIKNSVDYLISYVNHNDIGTAKKEELTSWKRAGIKIVRAVTPATPKNVKNLWKIYQFVLNCGVDKWAVNRNMNEKKVTPKR